MPVIQRTHSPIDGSLVAERPLLGRRELLAIVERARTAQGGWRRETVARRQALLHRFTTAFEKDRDEISRELTRQMGRPIRYGPLEVDGLVERAAYMTHIADQALAPVGVEPRAGFTRFVRREPLGVVLVLAPWNYPYLTAVNAVVPALLAGNAVVLKHSDQTPLCAERFAAAFAEAGLPEGLFQVAHADHDAVAALLESGAVDFASFTGSVAGGDAVQRAAARSRTGVGLELGGKDPAYVRADADLRPAAEALADGAFFNSGQSCCGVERIYVARERHDDFVGALVEAAHALRLDNPLDPATTLGPMVRPSAADFVRKQVEEALAMGARALVDPARFTANEPGSAYLAPQVLVDVDHRMSVMTQESFGPVVGVVAVDGDAEALAAMNDSRYGLTASIWTRDQEAALRLGDDLQTGTVFMNRCDYLDPALAWTGVKDSGRGCSLSRIGFESLTRPKSFHLRHAAYDS